MKARQRFPRISTRGFYSLKNGNTITNKKYDFYPAGRLEHLSQYPEIVIVVHGFRNNKSGALAKFRLVKKHLINLGYKYPVIGFSYDANVVGASLKSKQKKSYQVGKKIAKKNGKNLAYFIEYVKIQNPQMRIRLIGHSLGTEVILYSLEQLSKKIENKNMVESLHFFGSSANSNISKKTNSEKILVTIRSKIKNFYNPNDEVLKESFQNNPGHKPLGLFGYASKKRSLKFYQRPVKSKNHRFVNYLKTLYSFP